MASSHENNEPTMKYAPATNDDGDSSSGFSDDSSDSDDALFADVPPTRPQWEIQYPAQYSTASIEKNLSSEEHTACGTLEIYRNVVILDYASHSGNDPWIRLLRLKPGRTGQPLHCKIIKRPLWDAGEYIALSYSWGKNLADQEIYIEDQPSLEKPFHVSMHLWNALQRLREERRAVHVWIDAICIDQQNYVERAAQVNIMAQIFNLASEVRVWLGEGAFLDHPKTTDAQLFWALCQQPSPWWTRLWILQEVAYAKNCPVVMLGAHMMSFERLIERWHSVTRFESELSELRELDMEQRRVLAANFELLRTPFDIWTAQQKDLGHRQPLLQRLRETAGRECADPHDRIYALLSLISESEAKQFQPDYRKPYQELVLEVADVLRQSPSWKERHDNAVFTVLHPDEAVATILSNRNTAAQYGIGIAQALRDGNVKVAHALLTKCANLRVSQLPVAHTSYIASQSGLEDVAKMPADELVDINAQIYTPALLAAIEMRFEHVVKMLIDAGAAVDIRHLKGDNALQSAAHRGLEKSVQLLIDAGANVNSQGGPYGTALHAAIEGRHEKVVEILIGAGANVNAPHKNRGDPKVSTPLQAASYQGLEKSVRMLIDAGANVNTLGGNYGSALHDASFCGYEEIVKILIHAGADVNAQGRPYSTALQTASVFGHEKIVEIPLKNGSDVNARGGKYVNALNAASSNGYEKIVEMLLEKGADLNAQDDYFDILGRFFVNALHAALARDHDKVAKMLLDAGADVDILNARWKNVCKRRFGSCS